jgi:dTDP-4-dehydrorhamnose 3,5-epimerase
LRFEPLRIPDVVLLFPDRFDDERGFFSETFRAAALKSAGIDLDFVQDNHVLSTQRGVLRGLHFQAPPSAQGKLVRCTRGAILDVAVDIRHGSPTFGQHVSAELSRANWTQIWVPPGFAHGYITLDDECEVIYKVTSYYDRAAEGGVAWDDPALAIDWRFPSDAIVLSPKDQVLPTLAQAAAVFTYQAAGN